MLQASFEAEKNKKAFLYTVIICSILLLLAFLITFPILKIIPPISQDLIEINLGNSDEGFGETQPLIKGQMNDNAAPQPSPKQVNNSQAVATTKEAEPDENAEADAAPVTKTTKPVTKPTPLPTPTVKPITKVKNPASQTILSPKPPKPVATYKGPGNGKGNGATEDKGYQYQGNKPGGKSDAGIPSGKPDSYGNTSGGKSGGGPKVFGNRKIVKYYSFTGDLDKATINAIVKVSPAGIGTFVGFGKNSTIRSQTYANAIVQYLKNVQFDKSTEESTVIVQFNFNVQ